MASPLTAALIICLSAAAWARDESLQWRELMPLPDKLGVAGAFAGVSGDCLLVAGGANFPAGMPWEGGRKIWRDTVWMLDQPEGAWRAVGKLPRPLGYGISVTAPQGVVCIGGSDAERHYADVFRLVWKEGTLRVDPLPALPVPLANGCGAIVGKQIYVACGADVPGEQSALNRLFMLDLAEPSGHWRELDALPGKARILAASASDGERFYVLGGVALERGAGGQISRAYLRDAWSYRPGEGWKRLGELPQPSAAAPSPAPAVGGRILIIGGDDGSLVGFKPPEKHPGFPGAILAYDIAAGRWVTAGRVPAPRATLPCVQWRGLFIFPSGEARPGVRSAEVWTVGKAN